jgi:hypothetical protein
MQTKLTLRLDDRLIAKAKAWARARDTSLSEAVAQFFAQLPEADRQTDPTKLSPWTRRLLGAARVAGKPLAADEVLKRDYVDYLEAKYR